MKLEIHRHLLLRMLVVVLGMAVCLITVRADSRSVEKDADLIVYRQRAIVGMLATFEVSVNGAGVGELKNGSALRLRLAPGVYRLRVNPGFLTYKAESLVEVVGGEVRFVEYDFPTGILANIAYIGSSIEVRTAERARAEIFAFEAGGADGIAHVVDAEPVASALHATGFAAVDQVDSLPVQDARARSAYAKWLALPLPRAFVIGPNGYFSYATGETPKDKSLPSNPAFRALDMCIKARASGCRLYALNDIVLWPSNDSEKLAVEKNGNREDRSTESMEEQQTSETAPAPSDQPDATPTIVSSDRYPKTSLAEIGDVNSVPRISGACRERYATWLAWAKPKAFVVGPNGNCSFTTGTKPPSKDLPIDPVDRALEVCARMRYGNCKVYAIDDDVVWIKD